MSELHAPVLDSFQLTDFLQMWFRPEEVSKFQPCQSCLGSALRNLSSPTLLCIQSTITLMYLCLSSSYQQTRIPPLISVCNKRITTLVSARGRRRGDCSWSQGHRRKQFMEPDTQPSILTSSISLSMTSFHVDTVNKSLTLS